MYVLFVLPLLLLLACVLAVSILLRKWKLAVVSAVVFVLLNALTQSIPFNFWHGSSGSLEPDVVPLRVLSYNLQGDGDYLKHNTDSMRNLVRMIDSVNADVIFMPEYNPCFAPVLEDSLKLRYPYSMRPFTPNPAWGADNLYSKYPITRVSHFCDRDSVLWKFYEASSVGNAGYSFSERMLIYNIDIAVNHRTVSMIYCHLQSNNYTIARKNMSGTDRWIDGLDKYIDYTRLAYDARGIQARMMRDTIAVHKDNPILVCGDFNDLSGSYALRTIMDGHLKDAWWEKGCGFGFTYDEHHFLLRLDHILYSPHFDLRNVWVLDQYKFSDHYPLCADLMLKP